jgi:hypothetical protein
LRKSEFFSHFLPIIVAGDALPESMFEKMKPVTRSDIFMRRG